LKGIRLIIVCGGFAFNMFHVDISFIDAGWHGMNPESIQPAACRTFVRGAIAACSLEVLVPGSSANVLAQRNHQAYAYKAAQI
jgi:hypothetical protein